METRQRNNHIYLAGPDFPHIDTAWIDEMEKQLKAHGYEPHRPIQENGLFTGEETEEEQQTIYEKDVHLLEQSAVLVAVMLNDDPGTYVEVGWMAKSGKPVILFDPNGQVENLFLKKSADAVVHSAEEVIASIRRLHG